MTTVPSSEPEFIEEEIADVSMTVGIAFKDGSALKISARGDLVADLMKAWKTKDLREPETFVIEHGSGVSMVELSQVQSINALTGSKAQNKLLLQRLNT